MSKIKVGIVGVTGYSGRELLRILSTHPEVELVYVAAQTASDSIYVIWPELREVIDDMPVAQFSTESALAAELDLVFLATPHTVSHKLAPDFVKNKIKVIDLSGDFRLDNEDEYEAHYKTTHAAPELLDQAVYGLSEVFADEIAKADLVANPGCYPTASLLSVAPLLDEAVGNIIIDAKSGYSGAGIKKASELRESTSDSFKAYKVLAHQHAPEIELIAGKIAGSYRPVVFTPHLLPIERGILATAYVQLDGSHEPEAIHAKYEQFYKNHSFIKILEYGQTPELRDIAGTNDVLIGVAYDNRLHTAVITCAIDNLVKGASGQAVQNMNIIYGWPQETGLAQ